MAGLGNCQTTSRDPRIPLTRRQKNAVMSIMLGRIRRTTRTDVGLAIVFTGAAYLVWALVAGASRGLVLHTFPHDKAHGLHGLTLAIKIFFVDAGFMIDLVGLAWLAITLFLIVWSSRQKMSISWSWASAM